MINKNIEIQIVKWLFWGAIGVTVLVTSSISYDPVNVSKLLLLSGLGFALYFQIFRSGLRTLWMDYRAVTIGTIGFLIAGLWSFLNADNPKPLAFFGTFGRNTGFLTYISLVGVFLAALLLSARNSFKKIVWSLILAGWVNVIYCLSAALGYDPIAWNNVYNRILGTFGNPNFIGAFLGIYFVASLAFALGSETSLKQKVALLGALPVAFWEILETKAIQGLVLAVAGSGFVLFFVLRYFIGRIWLQLGYLLLAVTGGGFALAGALQVGPLTSLIYKTSVSLRGEYWAAGLNMGLHNLVTGVGWDGYGEWYRRERRPSALILPGPDTVTNAAHNVFIDIFAYGGLPLFLTYIFLFGSALVSSIKIFRRTSKYDPIFIALFSAWFCYNLQAIISINQIGLAIWGWILSGALIAMERSTRISALKQETLMPNEGQGRQATKAKNRDAVQLGGYLAGVSGFAIGLLIGLPPFINDSQWRSSLKSQDALKVFSSTVKWPMDSFRLANNAILFEQSNLPDRAYELAKKGAEYNPGSFDAWKVLASVSRATPEEKMRAQQMLKKLDPLNKNLDK